MHFEIPRSNPLQSPHKLLKYVNHLFRNAIFSIQLNFQKIQYSRQLSRIHLPDHQSHISKFHLMLQKYVKVHFTNVFFLSVIEFSENSDLKTIEKEAFSGTSINQIKIPPLFTNARILVQLNFLKIQNWR